MKRVSARAVESPTTPRRRNARRSFHGSEWRAQQKREARGERADVRQRRNHRRNKRSSGRSATDGSKASDHRFTLGLCVWAIGRRICLMSRPILRGMFRSLCSKLAAAVCRIPWLRSKICHPSPICIGSRRSRLMRLLLSLGCV